MSWICESSLNWLQAFCVKVIKCGQIPRHVAFIMDGNRRYAQKNGVKKIEGHSKGFDKLAETLQWCLDLGIPEVTVYAFSIENFKRSPEEVDALVELARQKFKRLLNEKDKLMEHGICIRIIGNISLLPSDVQKSIAEAMLFTKENKKAYLNVAFAYTAREEMTQAIKTVVSGVNQGKLSCDDVDHQLLDNCLYTNNSPEPDLLIRTSGEIRFSDFLLWQISCSCVYFTEVLWPEFSFWHMLSAVFYYQRCYLDVSSIRRAQDAIFPKQPQNDRVVKFLVEMNATRQVVLEDAKRGLG